MKNAYRLFRRNKTNYYLQDNETGAAQLTLIKTSCRPAHPEWIIPSIILIVGIHFFPLAVAFQVPRHYATGAAMTLLAIFYPLMSSAGPTSPVGCLGAGIILWASAVVALVRPA
jgi:hypothetical protein